MEINKMNYSQFVGLVDERNRPSGGIRTVQIATLNARIDRNSKVLEIGSNTGFTSVNISLLTGAEVVGIDYNGPSVEKAREYANNMGAERVKFLEADATRLPFGDGEFDMVWCSNVTSFIEDKDKAIAEYLRVLKPFGTLILVPIYYHISPPEKIRKAVSNAIGCEVGVWDKQFWLDAFKRNAYKHNVALEKYFDQEFQYLDRSANLKEYTELQLSKIDRNNYSDEEWVKIQEKAKYFYTLFNENNFKYARYSVILLQKRLVEEEAELFISRAVE
ncbi:MAG: methyltransferase domain-containing protein [Candidatus Saccharibacteria bacterium]|nr:methyltransferase domain-containing protein [Candidatus Saccharibacteria bacterium]